MDSELSEEFEVKVWMHHSYMLSHFSFIVVGDVLANLARDCGLS